MTNVTVCKKHRVEFCGARPCDICIMQAKCLEVERLTKALEDANGELSDTRGWLQRHIDRERVYIQTEYNRSGSAGNGYGAVPIPDWDARQRIDKLTSALAPAAGILEEADATEAARKAKNESRENDGADRKDKSDD